MGWFVVIFSALLLNGFCRGGPVTLTPGTCWVMGNLQYTFDRHYYTFVGNCTYTMAKNCHVSANLPAFEVDITNVYKGNVQVPSVGMVTINVHGINIEIERGQLGIVRVNYQQWPLPMNLNNGKVKLYRRGLFVIVETDFGLIVQYDWNEYLAITVPNSFSGSVCGLCGNFNGKKEDDLMTASGSVTNSVGALGESWRVPSAADDAYCRDGCGDQCEKCPLSQAEMLEKQIFCRALIQNIIELAGCQPDINSTVIQSNCMLDLCWGEAVNVYLYNTIQGYADICWRSGFQVPDWRKTSQSFPPKCRENSHYEVCASSCPATCANPNQNCTTPCVEDCVCDDGFVLSSTKCVQKAECGCMYQGHYVEAGESFWGDQNCTKWYTCSAGGQLFLNQTSCPVGQQCQVVKGIRGCYPFSHATCMVSGDQHFVTFDEERYNFQGTCTYQMAGVSSNKTGLERFSVVLQNNGQDERTGSAVKVVEVKVYGHTFVISKDYPGTVVVNGELSHLPMMLNNSKLYLHTNGRFAVIETNFGVKVYYDWSSIAWVTVPRAYMDMMQGLCGNYNLNPKDDMQMRDGKQASSPEELGQSWKVVTTPGCVDGCSGPCPGCNTTQRALYNTSSYCGLIIDPAGPFRDCHSKVDPADFFNDCLYDVCFYQGSGNIQCETLAAYTAVCQLSGTKVYSWRSAQFCDAQCPSNSHYELCTSSCMGSCGKDFTPSNCGAHCMEGCTCNDGYLMSGNECVSVNQCGCMYEDKYYQQGQVFYPDALCQKECTCNGTVQCEQSSCGPYEKCGTKNYVRSCQPMGKGVCSIYGDPHYNTFDNTTYNFQGTCTYIVAEGCHLNGTGLTKFSVAVENEKWYVMSDDPRVSVAKLVEVEVYGTRLILRRNEVKMVSINGILRHLPQYLFNGAVKVYQEGGNDVIMTDFGLRVTYDLVYHITVTVPENYHGRTCGLCGNFNRDKADDFQLPNGNLTKNIQAFGAAWKVSVPGVFCEDGCGDDFCPKCDDSKKSAIEAKCAIITDPDGPFAACQSVVDPEPYFRDCVYDVCMAKDEQTMMCHSIGAYMLDCQEFNAKTEKWRSPTFCPFTCPANSHYELCVQPCTSPCPGLPDIVPCNTTCFEGCTCDEGYYFNGTGCVSIDKCSCYYYGYTLEIGQSIMTDDCYNMITCLSSGLIVSNTTCDPNESCQVKNGVLACAPQQCSLDSNGTLTMFKGEVGIVTEPGTYEIIQTSDQLQPSNWFRVVVKLDTCTPGVNTIMALYVFFSEVMFSINNNHDIWINGRAMNQTSFSQNNITVVVANNTVTITSPSNLKLSFSSANTLTMSVSDKVADSVIGACGKLEHVDVAHRPIPPIASWNITMWIAPDFPQCGLETTRQPSFYQLH